VVAIIAILAAIAVPNFLDAQVRSKVSRVLSEHRTISIAMEAYAADWNTYMVKHRDVTRPQYGYGSLRDFIGLTTPIAYLTSELFVDPFNEETGIDNEVQPSGDDPDYGYINLPVYRAIERIGPFSEPPSYVLQSKGPDRMDSGRTSPTGDLHGSISAYGKVDPKSNNFFEFCTYDPTNGTVSPGDILRWGPQ
jgi:type II secretory pathway pseudopilin PulG